MCGEIVGYECWIVDECNDTSYNCSWFENDEEMNKYMEEHPKYKLEMVPVYK